MQQLIYFFRKYRYFLFFLLLQFIALTLIINNHNFHKSKFVTSANNITGGFYNKTSSISDYFQLNNENKELIEENTSYINRIEQLENILDSVSQYKVIDTTKYFQQYFYISGRIQKNQYSFANNFLTINLGRNDSIDKEMAVINSKGIIGITEKVSDNYSRVQSILNQKSAISVRLKKNSTHIGNLKWDGKDYNVVQLEDLPRQAEIQKGDTIITSGNSAIFPEGVPVGTAINVIGGETSVGRIVNIQLFNDMSNLKNIYVVKNFDKLEIRKLESNQDE
ncbi:rod shape-determining protein MreC [Pseudotenacibaculum sp. MALMAid0570]|uniref:rod shape-determining protein MreC n=1 Tax=Pseudotenacibaculum sp. MALMAid0570 TaxID=3143938 RepID=UPI0032DE9967